MQLIINNLKFLSDYRRLKDVSLNPARHTAENAYEHCEMVVKRVKQLAKRNHCSEEDTTTLVNLAYVHDIGKVQGTAKPEKSVALLPKYEKFDQHYVNLVKYHDINLPWYISHTKREAPSHKAWQKLSRKVDLRLLCLFMVADRVDCPGGWQQNKALVWFLGQCQNLGFVKQELIVDECDTSASDAESKVELCAGGTLLDVSADQPRILVLRMRNHFFELPKGHIEKGETATSAAVREFSEETGLNVKLNVKSLIGELNYQFLKSGEPIQKKVSYFMFEPVQSNNSIDLVCLTKNNCAIHWLSQYDIDQINWVSEELRLLIASVLEDLGLALDS